MKVMLDTNICIYIIKQKPISVLKEFKKYQVKEIGISTIVYAELLNGVYKSERIEQNLTALSNFISPLEIVDYDEKAAVEYGLLRSFLEKNGKVIGANDMLIAAHAKSLSLPLATNNIKEFNRIEGLELFNWV